MSCFPFKKLMKNQRSKKYELSPQGDMKRKKEYINPESYRHSVFSPCTLPQVAHKSRVSKDLLKANPILESVAGTSPFGTIKSKRRRPVTPKGFDIVRGVNQGNLSKSDESFDSSRSGFERTPSPRRS